ncbi:MAG: PAS domain-containing protein, partial [Chloroflexota bacterium]
MSDLAQATESSEAADKILAASRLQSLADVSAVFAEVSLDYTSAIDTVTRRIAELLGDLCAVLLLSDDGVWLEPVAIRHPDAQSERMARSLTNLLRVPALGGLGNVVVGEGQAVAVEKLEDWMFSDVTRPFYYSYRELVGDFGMLAAPLRAQGKIIGMVLVLRTHSARAHPTDLRYLQDLADRAAITIAGARLHQSVQQELAARWAAEQALLRSERELRTLVENSPDSILRYDRELRIVYINHVAATLLGQPPEQLLGRTLDEIEMLRTATGNFRRHAQQVLATGEPQAYTEELRAADGELRFFHAQIVPEFGSQGTVESILVIARDLTDQRRTQKEIEQLNRTLEARVLQRTAQLQSAYQELHEITRLHQASQARLQFVLSQTPAVIFTAHYDGDHALTFISDSVRDLVGFEPQQFYESPGLWFERVHPEDRDALFSHLRALLSDGRRTIEYRFRHADGTDRWLRSGMSLIRDASGEPQEVIGYLVDISEHKETEEALRLANVELHLANVELA